MINQQGFYQVPLLRIILVSLSEYSCVITNAFTTRCMFFYQVLLLLTRPTPSAGRVGNLYDFYTSVDVFRSKITKKCTKCTGGDVG